jgi:hypothetical protein
MNKILPSVIVYIYGPGNKIYIISGIFHMLEKRQILYEILGPQGGENSSWETGQYTSTKRTKHQQHQGITGNK